MIPVVMLDESVVFEAFVFGALARVIKELCIAIFQFEECEEGGQLGSGSVMNVHSG